MQYGNELSVIVTAISFVCGWRGLERQRGWVLGKQLLPSGEFPLDFSPLPAEILQLLFLSHEVRQPHMVQTHSHTHTHTQLQNAPWNHQTGTASFFSCCLFYFKYFFSYFPPVPAPSSSLSLSVPGGSRCVGKEGNRRLKA